MGMLKMKKNIIASFFLFILLILSCRALNNRIDRFELVNRHNIRHSDIDPLNSLTVGNGEFAFTADITGMQTFPAFYEAGIPLGTQSQWGWHSFPNPENYTLEDVLSYYPVGQDSIPYPYQYNNSKDELKNKATAWLRENPHRLHLGLIGLQIMKQDSSAFTISDIQNPDQKLELWNGVLKSNFQVDSVDVEVITVCHQELDMVSFRISSQLIPLGKLNIILKFPYATHEKFSPGYDLNSPEKHSTQLIHETKNEVTFKQVLDNTLYYAQLQWTGKAELKETEKHSFLIIPADASVVFEINCCFTPELNKNDLPSFSENLENNRKHWQSFWESGGAIDFSQCTDPRAMELERRVVLSQYLTKVQCSGSLPPQETGLTYNSWHGKFHLEMHWWHAIHFILWQRPELMEQQLTYYSDIFNEAQNTALLQGYEGIRWPKMTDPDGRESPSTIGPFLIWQQSHIIYFAELLYNVHRKDPSVLEKYKPLVFATADFMASYARWDIVQNRYILGPPLIPAQECFDAESTVNPTFELEYWRWGLQTAQKWRKRLDQLPNPKWQQIIDKLAWPSVKDSLYLFTEDATDSYNQKYLIDHPIVLGISGFLPASERVDKNIMQNTLTTIMHKWNWETAWGWDFPMAAINAANLNLPELAVDLLLMDTPKNHYLMNGHNYQRKNLTIYLPGNGALLTAVAMMCACKNQNKNNGFPSNGQWKVKYENLFYPY